MAARLTSNGGFHGVWAKAFTTAAWVTGAGSILAALSCAASTVPSPEAYPARHIQGGNLDRVQLKFRNTGGSLMVLQNIQVYADGKPVQSLAAALSDTANPAFAACTEATNFLQGGFRGRNVARGSGITLLTVYPAKVEQERERQAWADEFENLLAARRVELEVTYQYCRVPFLGPLFTSTARLHIGRRSDNHEARLDA
jgi:hypothetical protein